MTDLEMTRLCAEALGYKYVNPLRADIGNIPGSITRIVFDPIHDDAQALALIKKFGLCVRRISPTLWATSKHFNLRCDWIYSTGLNRAVIECVAKMQKEKQK